MNTREFAKVIVKDYSDHRLVDLAKCYQALDRQYNEASAFLAENGEKDETKPDDPFHGMVTLRALIASLARRLRDRITRLELERDVLTAGLADFRNAANWATIRGDREKTGTDHACAWIGPRGAYGPDTHAREVLDAAEAIGSAPLDLTHRRLSVAFRMISKANTVTVLSLDEMEACIRRALSGELDVPSAEGRSRLDEA